MSRILFAMELSIRVDGDRLGLVEHLRSYVRASTATVSRAEKQVYWRKVSELLLRELPNCARGIWDYSDDPSEAKSMFADYADVLKSKKGARTVPVSYANQGPMRTQAGELFCNVTFAWLVVGGGDAAKKLADACNMHKSFLWDRRIFARLLQLMPSIAPGRIESDVFYVIPGDASFALTQADLDGSDFSYLRIIQD